LQGHWRYSRPIAGQNKKNMNRCNTKSPGSSDLQALTLLHVHARRRLDEIHEDAGVLQAAGKILEARILQQQGDAIEHGLRVLESELQTAADADLLGAANRAASANSSS
jgi:hypothetical protein